MKKCGLKRLSLVLDADYYFNQINLDRSTLSSEFNHNNITSLNKKLVL